MVEQIQRKGVWQKVEVGKGHFISVRPIDPEIQKQMPIASRTFMQVGFIESLVYDIKKLLHPGQKNTF